MEIIKKYESANEAVEHILRLSIAYLMKSIKMCNSSNGGMGETFSKQLISKGYLDDLKNSEQFHNKILNVNNNLFAAVFDIDDTLLFDAGENARSIIPHKEIIFLLRRLKSLGFVVHLVTARLDDAYTTKETMQELRQLDVDYDSLTLAPEEARSSLADVSKWKQQMRKQIAHQLGCPIVLTVGDQWGDMVIINNDDQIDELDEFHSAAEFPYAVVRPRDGVSLWGLKLPSY